MDNLKHFILPSIDGKKASFSKWLAVLILSLPIYCLGYWGIYKALKSDSYLHFWVLGIFLTIFVFSMFFGLQHRFRVITLEPFLVLYASNVITKLTQKNIALKFKKG